MSRQNRTTGNVPIYRQLAHEFAACIREGKFAPGAALPTVRALADERGIDRGTVTRAYALLTAWDLVISEGRRGTRVCETTMPSGPTPSAESDTLVQCAGSHDFCLDVLARLLRPRGVQLATRPTGSTAGLVALAAGTVDIAGSHLLDDDGADYNHCAIRRTLPGRDVRLVTLIEREQGLIVPRATLLAYALLAIWPARACA